MTSVGRLDRLNYLIRRGVEFAPDLIRHPRSAKAAARGVHLASYLDLQPKWIRTANIRTVIDIGANAGQFASAIHEVLPSANVYSFEPLPEAFQQLERRFAGCDWFHAFPVALGDKPSKIAFHQNAFAKASSPLKMSELHRDAFPWTSETTPIEVDVRTLDSFASDIDLRERVLTKIDVQGFEDRVLRGGEKILGSSDFVFIETSFEPLYEEQATFEQVYETMLGYGFRFSGVMDQLKHPDDDRILQGDAIFIQRSIAT